MSNPKLSFEEACRQVDNLMAAIGGNVDAYEGGNSDEDSQDVSEALDRLRNNPDPPVPHEKVVEELGEDDSLMCATGLDELEDSLMPEILDPERFVFHNVVECLGTLEFIWQAFEKANQSGKEGSVNLPGRSLEISRLRSTWEIKDHLQNIWYLQADSSDLAIRGLNDKDIFVWVLPLEDKDDFAPELGYIHNGYVFMRRQENPGSEETSEDLPLPEATIN